MALIKCKNCGKQISDKAEKCIHCGTIDYKLTESEIKNIQKDEEINTLKQKLNEEKENIRKKELDDEKKDEEIRKLKKELEQEKLKVKEQELNDITDDEEIKKLKNELEEERLKTRKKELEKQIQKEKSKNKKKQNIFVVIINLMRYCIAVFWTFGAVVFLLDGFQIKANISSLLLGLPFYPFIYNLLFKKINLSHKTQLIIQILLPIICFIISGFIGF